jgi:hypothetical protein
VAEVAEAVGVPTDCVFAAIPLSGTTFVFYSPRVDVQPVEMKRAMLFRDNDGVLSRFGAEIDLANVNEIMLDRERLLYLE